MDEDFVIYNTEMQKEKKSDLIKRSRYYQAMVDTSLLEPGIPSYNLLNISYIIMITTFDLFGYDRCVYTFKSRCEEEPGCCLEDGATRIFLNTRGKNHSGVTDELLEFLVTVHTVLCTTLHSIGANKVMEPGICPLATGDFKWADAVTVSTRRA